VSALGDFAAYLRVDAGVIVAVGLAEDGAAKVYVGKAPQGVAMPYVVVTRIAEPPHHHYEGVVAIASPTYQVLLVASSSVATEAMETAVRARIDGYVGPMGGTSVHGAFVIGSYDDVVPTGDGSDELPFSTVLDVELWHEKP
jgi:hypothetical protein